MRLKIAILPILLVLSSSLFAQTTFPKNGVYDERDGHYAFTNATIQISPDKRIESATMLIKKGKIVEVGTVVDLPKDAVVIDLKGKYIYPSFIDLQSDYGMPKITPAKRDWNAPPQTTSKTDGAYSWNQALKPEIRADQLFKVDKKKAKTWREGGFGTVLTHQNDGLARGSSAMVLLGDDREHEMILKGQVGAHYSFSKGSSGQNYPSSLMGMIALLRQTHYDAQWYQKNKEDIEYNISLEKWSELDELPQFFHTIGLSTFRADKLGDEFNKQFIFVGGSSQYRRIETHKATGGAYVISLDFPKAYDVSDPFDAMHVDITAMKHWELAPTNPAKMAEAGIEFALTSLRLKTKAEFLANLRKAYQFGLSEEDALKALTTTPAKLINMSDQLGTLEKGKIANFLITSGNILSEKSVIYHNWVKGKAYTIKPLNTGELRGKYDLTFNKKSYTLDVKGSADKPVMNLSPAKKSKKDKSKPTKLKYSYSNGTISFSFVPSKDTSKKTQEIYRFSGTVDGANWAGRATTADGTWFNWKAKRSEEFKEKALKMPKLDSTEMGEVIYPFVPYGYAKEDKPKAEKTLIKGATVWTGEKEGKLESTDVLIENGKIAQIGKGLTSTGAKVVSGKGKHLTAGIIDEHSHIAISRGVNEGTQASSAEVSIADVVKSEDVNLYRQLGGGVTMAQLLHGSANPIGGQSALIKFRWGSTPEEMKYVGADGFIKFALGENVKQSNWGNNNRSRFPQTRMGVEQVYEDHFTRAREYGEAMKKDADKTRRDLELDALLEILEKKRFITCHSYVQSEITMLMRVAERHGFRLNTFTHILEGYKIADKMKAHGAGGSTFSDWWAYKAEVMDAIPYNPKILDEMGVIIAINSDDAEMGRRLNQEAAKGVKYGGMTEEAAWNMVTLNPAKLLHVDDKVGSIKVGKDADVVLWSDNPLSVYARVEKTFVDGICYYDMEEDKKKREALKAERNRLVQKMLNAKAKGAKTQPAVQMPKTHYHCGDSHLNSFDFLNETED